MKFVAADSANLVSKVELRSMDVWVRKLRCGCRLWERDYRQTHLTKSHLMYVSAASELR